MAKKIFTIRKYMGDDRFSWAVFDSRSGRPVVTGCDQREARWRRDELEKQYNPITGRE